MGVIQSTDNIHCYSLFLFIFWLMMYKVLSNLTILISQSTHSLLSYIFLWSGTYISQCIGIPVKMEKSPLTAPLISHYVSCVCLCGVENLRSSEFTACKSRTLIDHHHFIERERESQHRYEENKVKKKAMFQPFFSSLLNFWAISYNIFQFLPTLNIFHIIRTIKESHKAKGQANALGKLVSL